MAKDYSKVSGVVSRVSSTVDDVATRIGQEVASVGNTVDDVATRIGQEVANAAPNWQSVVDRASNALESGADYVADAAEDIYEALPEMDDVVEGVQDAATAVVDTAKTGYKYFKAVTSPVAMNFLDDLLLGRARTALGVDPIAGSEEFFSDETITLLKTMITDRGGLKAGETMGFDKKVYTDLSKKYGSKIKVVQTGGSDSGAIIDALANRNPADEVKNILGSFSVSADEEGNLTIEDRFNYNEWKHPVTQKEYNKAEFDKAIEDGEFSVSEMVGKSWDVYGSSYGFVRSLGFLLGSQDSGEEGRKDGRLFKLNLGNVKDLGSASE